MTVTDLPNEIPDQTPHQPSDQIPLRSVDVHPVLLRAGAPPAARDLLAQAQRTLVRASKAEDPLERYATAHLAALRTTAAVLAVRGRPETNPRRRKAIRSAWEVLPEIAPSWPTGRSTTPRAPENAAPPRPACWAPPRLATPTT